MFTNRNRNSMTMAMGGSLLALGILIRPGDAVPPQRVMAAPNPTVMPRPIQPFNPGYLPHWRSRYPPMPGRDWWRIYPWSPYNIHNPFNPYSPYYQPWLDPIYPVPLPGVAPLPLPSPGPLPFPGIGLSK